MQAGTLQAVPKQSAQLRLRTRVTLLNQSIKVTRAGFAGGEERSGPGQGEKGPGDEKTGAFI